MRAAWMAIIVVMLGCGTTDNTGGGGSTAASSGTSSSSTGGLCIPGQQIACACPGGAEKGAQACLPGGTGYGPCEGCGGSGSTSSGQGGASSGSSSGGASGAGGAAPMCTQPSDCGPSTDCQGWNCTAGKCGTVYAKDGTKVAAQIPGDCSDIVCDGQGGAKTITDLMDIQDDANACTTDACSMQAPTHLPVAIGTPCPTGLCDGGLMCVAHIPVKCQIKNGPLYVGCDGIDHPGLTISWSNGMVIGACQGTAAEAVYCPPGAACSVSLNGIDQGLGSCK